MKIHNTISKPALDVKLAVVFAISMLLTSVLVSGHEHTGALVILQVGLYFVVVGLTRKNKVCHQGSVQ